MRGVFFGSSLLSVAAACVLNSAPASAAMITFELGNHPDAILYNAATSPTGPYGIRADAIPDTFSVADNLSGGAGGPVYLSWDPVAVAAGSPDAIATITGTVQRDSDGKLLTVNYTLKGLQAANVGDKPGFIATDLTSAGSITDGAIEIFAWTGEADTAGRIFEFIADGHRLDGYGYPADAYSGRGWLTGSGDFNDFLVTATVVPLPAAAWLLISGLAVLVGTRRVRGS